MSHRSPETWDPTFINSMLTWRDKLSSAQQEQLMRLLQDAIITEEYPDGLKL